MRIGRDTGAGCSPARWDDHRMAQAQRRVALVTGSSRGLGAVIARRYGRIVVDGGRGLGT
jgi:hypothetical protein